MTPPNKIAVSVLVVTRNEAPRIGRCLRALAPFDEIVVIDSISIDKTASLALSHGASVVDFAWNGRYPKKRQWCLDNLPLRHSRIFFVDADEVVTPALAEEIRSLRWDRAGYFVRGVYVTGGAPLRFGLRNNKLALLERRKIHFPVVDDLAIPGMGEIEGHYQPVLKNEFRHEMTGQLKEPLLHYAYEDENAWRERHMRYAAWEKGMDERRAWPAGGRLAKRIFRRLPLRGCAAFLHCYFLKLGFLDGRRGFEFACSRYGYYRMTLNKMLNRASENRA